MTEVEANGAVRSYGVLGAGSIGCFVGGMLARAGKPVTLVGRQALVDSVRASGLSVRLQNAEAGRVSPEGIRVSTKAEDLKDCDVVFVAVKSAGTARAAEELARAGVTRPLVISLQNGIRNPSVLRSGLPGVTVLGGMVSFNVIWNEPADFAQATSGPVVLEAGAHVSAVAGDLRAAGLTVLVRADMENVQWSKLLLNLNNAVNALCGIPIREELAVRTYRRVLAASMREGLAVFARARIKMVRFGRLIPKVAPFVLGLPDWLFFRVAAAMVNIDPEARSSMADDLTRRRNTEIGELNGEIVKLGAELGVPTPVNSAIVALIRQAEAAQAGSPRLSASDLAAAVGLRL